MNIKPYFSSQREWPEGYRLAAQMNFHFPKFSQLSLADIVPGVSIEGLTLLGDMLKWNPSLRPTAVLVRKCKICLCALADTRNQLITPMQFHMQR